MAGKFYLIGFIAGIIMIAIGATSIFISHDEFAFIRGMMLIITGVIVFGLAIRFRTLSL